MTEAGRPVPLTPQQLWFFQQSYVDPNTIAACELMELTDQLDRVTLARVAAVLVGLHDASRISFRDGGTGWTAWKHDTMDPQLLTRPPLCSKDKTLERLAESAAVRITADWDGVSAPLIVIQPLTAAGDRHGLLLVAHHLVIDGVAMRILQQSITTALAGGSGRALAAAASLSATEWADRLHRWASSSGLIGGELEYWLGQVNGQPELDWLPAPAGRVFWLELTDAQTARLTELARSRRLFLGEAFLGLLHQAFAAPRPDGRPLVQVDGATDLFGIGRESPFPGCRIDGTVSWLATRYPLRLEPAKAELTDTLLDTARALRAVPNGGIGYEVLRFLAPAEIRGALASRRGLSYNYVGRNALPAGGSAVVGCQPVRLPAKSGYRCAPWISVNAALENGRLRTKIAGPATSLDDYRCARLPEVVTELLGAA